VAGSRPLGISGAAFLYGYLRSAVTRTPRVDDEGFRRFTRRELRDRLLRRSKASDGQPSFST
jgi:hypothetical protein